MARAILAVVLLTSVGFSFQAPKTGSIQVRACDVLGDEIEPKSIDVDLLSSDGKKLPGAFQNGIAENVPHGDYQLVVWSGGFKAERRAISLHVPKAVYHFTMEIGSIAD